MIYRTMIWSRLITDAALASALATAAVAQDVTAGEKTFNVCRACHEIGVRRTVLGFFRAQTVDCGWAWRLA